MASRQVFVFSCVIALISASAIPMWEYLSKDEKMAYLYNMFANQVEDFCGKHTMEDCNKELLKYGLQNLHRMPEDHLDTMDPYQRDANDMIWKSMMEGHQMVSKKPFGNRQTTANPDKNAYDFFSESNYLGSASSRQETVLNLSGTLVSKTDSTTKAPNTHYGPMVVKVHLDGRPVQEEKSVPIDDDVHHYQIVKTKVPSLSSLEKKENTVPVYKNYSPYPYAVYSRPSRR